MYIYIYIYTFRKMLYSLTHSESYEIQLKYLRGLKIKAHFV